ncbi:MAG: hypothetical protein PHQ86_08935 [Dehalococcoidales bacterium]|nr:hypothetical protein [Dehalococcoidales bacterium]
MRKSKIHVNKFRGNTSSSNKLIGTRDGFSRVPDSFVFHKTTSSALSLPTFTKQPVKEVLVISCPCELNDPQSIRTFLGVLGMNTLQRVLNVVCNKSNEENWPLLNIQIYHVNDPDVPNWEYIRIIIVFASDFEAADRYIHIIYPILDDLSKKLSPKQAEILQKKLFFDVTNIIPEY